MVEQRSPKPRVEGSSPSAPASNKRIHKKVDPFFMLIEMKRTLTRKGIDVRLLTIYTLGDKIKYNLIQTDYLIDRL